MRAWLAVLVVSAGCGGDPRKEFVGAYSGSVTQTTTFSSGSTREDSSQVDLVVLAQKDTDRLELIGDCDFTAEVVDEYSFQIDPVACPPHRGLTNGGAMATFQETWSQGVGTLTNRTLVITQVGERVGTNYSNEPGASYRFQLRINMTVTK